MSRNAAEQYCFDVLLVDRKRKFTTKELYLESVQTFSTNFSTIRFTIQPIIPSGSCRVMAVIPASYLKVSGSVQGPETDYPDLWFTSIPPEEMRQYFIIGHDHIPLHPSQFLLNNHSTNICYANYAA
jgi:hypothetical protein